MTLTILILPAGAGMAEPATLGLAILGLVALGPQGRRGLPLSYPLRSLRARWRTTALAGIGVALVVAVLVALLAMAGGFRNALAGTGRDDNALVTRQGGMSELTSMLTREQAALLAERPEVARASTGEPLASAELLVIANLPRRDGEGSANVTVRGVTSRARDVRGAMTVERGRWFEPGRAELVVGRRIADRIVGCDPGSEVEIGGRSWLVTGILAAEGSAFESEIWGDAEVMAPVFQRQDVFQSVTVRLVSPLALDALAAGLGNDPRLGELRAERESDYYRRIAGPTAGALQALAALVALIMGVGAAAGAMNTVSALVAERTREIATLRVLGHSRRAVFLGFLLEGAALSLVGGLLGVLLTLPVHGLTTGTSRTLSFSEVGFRFEITPGVLAAGLAVALVLGVAGAALPAWRASRMTIAEALREG